MNENIVVFIKAYGSPITKDVIKKVPTGEVKKNWLGLKKEVKVKVTEQEEVGHSDCQVDAVRLSNDLARAVEEYNDKGFEVVSVTPIISGAYNFKVQEGTGYKKHAFKATYAFGYGFSFTEGLTVIFKKTCNAGRQEQDQHPERSRRDCN